MKLTNYMRDAFIRSVMQDVPHPDYSKLHDEAQEALGRGVPVGKLIALPVREQIGRFKYVHAADAEKAFGTISDELNREIEELSAEKED